MANWRANSDRAACGAFSPATRCACTSTPSGRGSCTRVSPTPTPSPASPPPHPGPAPALAPHRAPWTVVLAHFDPESPPHPLRRRRRRRPASSRVRTGSVPAGVRDGVHGWYVAASWWWRPSRWGCCTCSSSPRPEDSLRAHADDRGGRVGVVDLDRLGHHDDSGLGLDDGDAHLHDRARRLASTAGGSSTTVRGGSPRR